MEVIMKKTASVLVGLFVITVMLCFQTIGADKQQFCNNYADNAVRQYRLGKQHNLPGIVPPVWSDDRKGHFNWCMAVPENFANGERTKRQAYLDKNIAHDASNKKTTGTIVGTAGLMHDNMDALIAAAAAISDKSFLGCFKDSNNRDLSGFSFKSPRMTKKLCMDTCRGKGFKYAGLQYSQQCFCGNSYGKLGKSDNCKMPCSGNKGEICGGSWANSVYRVESVSEKSTVAASGALVAASGTLAGVSSTKLSLHKPIDLKATQNFLLMRANAKNKQLLSPLESPMFDVPVFQRSQAVEIGRGYNSLLKTPKLPALQKIPESQIQVQNVSGFSFYDNYVKSTKEYYQHLGVEVGLSGSYMFASGSSLSQFISNKHNNKYNETFVASIDVETYLKFPTLTELKLNPTAVDVLKKQGVTSFYQQYGDSFVYAIQYGAGLKGSASYSLVQNKEHFSFKNKTEAGVNTGIWSANVSTKIASETRERKENEKSEVIINGYGATFSIPTTVNELDQAVKKFLSNASSFAQQAGNGNEYGGIVRYTVIKYSNLPEFQQLTGGPDRLNLVEARKILDKLLFYQRKFERMRNNLNYITEHPKEFTPRTVADAKDLLRQKMPPLLGAINNDIGQLQRNPFDHQLLSHIADTQIRQYQAVPDYAPSTKYVTVTIDFPAEYTSSALGRQGNNPHNYWDDHIGPLIGYDLLKGDADVYSSCCIDVNINTRLVVRKQKDVYLEQHFLEHENKGDHTTIEGNKTGILLYTAPEGYKVVGLKQDRADFYHLRNLRGENKSGGPVFDVLYGLPSKPDDLWDKLSVIIDNDGGDFPYVGLFGTMTIAVGIEELAPKE